MLGMCEGERRQGGDVCVCGMLVCWRHGDNAELCIHIRLRKEGRRLTRCVQVQVHARVSELWGVEGAVRSVANQAA